MCRLDDYRRGSRDNDGIMMVTASKDDASGGREQGTGTDEV
jgi:hypothetical protein